MSISQEERRSEALALLKLLFQVLGESAIDCTRFDSSDARFRGIQSTSWDELCSEGLLKMQTDSLYVFTPAGWSEAVFRAGIVSASDFKECLGRLSGVLKGHVKGRQKGAVVPFEDLVRVSALPAGWVFNVIDSHLIARLQGRRDASWFESARGRLVEIPRDFGLIKIDLFSDVRAQNLELQEKVEEMEELYPEYRCEYCSAPVVGIHEWEHEYGSEQVTEYACGHSVGGPYDVPCTKNDKFPKFEDFVLRTTQAENGWRCDATSDSNVFLMPTWARTEQEARAAMHLNYLERAKPWK